MSEAYLLHNFGIFIFTWQYRKEIGNDRQYEIKCDEEDLKKEERFSRN